MSSSAPTADSTPPRSSTLAFALVSLGLHGAFFVLVAWSGAGQGFELELPEEVELGVMDGELGGEPAPAAAPAAAPPEPVEPLPEPVRPEAPGAPADFGDVVVDASVPLDAAAPRDGGVADAAAAPSDASAEGTVGVASGPDLGEAAYGDGLARVWGAGGDGEGGFGGGRGSGFAGAVIGLHANLARIRDTALILETRALLEIIPEWERVLAGSGLDPLADLDRVFVATPNLKRGSLVVAARPRGGLERVRRAAARLARERGKSIAFTPHSGFEQAPWHSRGPTARVVALSGGSQFVVARPQELPRVLALGEALAERHRQRPGMERARGPAALLSMMAGEAVALSVEGARSFVSGSTRGVPLALRLSLRELDEFHSHLTATGYYATVAEAAGARAYLEERRGAFAAHPRAEELGIRSALEEASLSQAGVEVRLSGKLTMHQTRYLLQFVTHVLRPRD